MTACRKWNDFLLDHALGVPPARELMAHLESCAACAARLAALARSREQLDAALAGLVAGTEPSPAFRARVLAAIEAEPAVSGQPAWVGALAAVAVVLLAAAWLPSRMAPEHPRAAVSISEWRSPTESLLRTPGEEFWRSTPRLGESYFPMEISPSETNQKNGGNHES